MINVVTKCWDTKFWLTDDPFLWGKISSSLQKPHLSLCSPLWRWRTIVEGGKNRPKNRAEANHSSRRVLLDCCKNGGTRRDENVIGHESGGALTMKSQLFREAAAGSGIALYIREPALWRHVMPDDAHRDVHRVSWSESWQLLLAPRRQIQQRRWLYAGLSSADLGNINEYRELSQYSLVVCSIYLMF